MKRLAVILSGLVYLLLAAAPPCRAAEDARSAPKAMVLAWDGAVPGFVHEMLRDGKLPNLAKLIGGGAFADDVMPGFPSLTAPGFASLWTGAPPRVTGISGNRQPRSPAEEFTILENAVGFSPALLRAEPLWLPAERAGRKVLTVFAPLAGDKTEPAVHLQSYTGIVGRDGTVDGRKTKAHAASSWKNLPPSMAPPLEVSFRVGGSDLFGLLIDEPDDPQEGYDTFLVAGRRDGKDIQAKLKAAAPGPGGELFWSGPVSIHSRTGVSAITYMRLFDLDPDGANFFLYFTRPTRPVMTAHPELLEESTPSMKAFAGNGANALYLQGGFGPTLFQGGDGTAEKRYLETVNFVQHQLMETARWCLEHIPWDLFIAYTPYPDEAEHLWRGYLDIELSSYRTEIAARLRPFLERVYRTADDFLGLLMSLRPDNTILALVSDHGMAGADKLVAVNAALQKNELLVLDEQNHVDLSKTKVLYAANGYLLINSTARKGGIVTPAERDEVVERVRESLLDIRDGVRQVVTAVYDAESDGATLGIGGAGGGDLYLDLLPGYEADAKLTATEVIGRREPHGTHGFNPARRDMRTIMVLNGPGIKSGAELRDVRIVDFAPTLARALHFPAPRDAWGRTIDEAFVPDLDTPAGQP